MLSLYRLTVANWGHIDNYYQNLKCYRTPMKYQSNQNLQLGYIMCLYVFPVTTTNTIAQCINCYQCIRNFVAEWVHPFSCNNKKDCVCVTDIQAG